MSSRKPVDTKTIPAGPSSQLRLSAAICTNDHPRLLERCLASLKPCHDVISEIVVVDNGSESNRETMHVARAHGAVYVAEPVPGLGAARNRAIATAGSDLVAFTDDDCVVTPEWASSLVLAFRDSSIGAVTGRTTAGPEANRIQRAFERYTSVQHQDMRVRIDPREGQPRTPPGVGANMAFRREALEEAGPVPEDLIDSGDDQYMLRSVLAAGWSVLYEPAAVVVQEHRSSLGAQLIRCFEYGRSQMRTNRHLVPRRGRGRLPLEATRMLAGRAGYALRLGTRGRILESMFAVAQLAGICSSVFLPSRARSSRQIR